MDGKLWLLRGDGDDLHAVQVAWLAALDALIDTLIVAVDVAGHLFNATIRRSSAALNGVKAQVAVVKTRDGQGAPPAQLARGRNPAHRKRLVFRRNHRRVHARHLRQRLDPGELRAPARTSRHRGHLFEPALHLQSQQTTARAP